MMVITLKILSTLWNWSSYLSNIVTFHNGYGYKLNAVERQMVKPMVQFSFLAICFLFFVPCVLRLSLQANNLTEKPIVVIQVSNTVSGKPFSAAAMAYNRDRCTFTNWAILYLIIILVAGGKFSNIMYTLGWDLSVGSLRRTDILWMDAPRVLAYDQAHSGAALD